MGGHYAAGAPSRFRNYSGNLMPKSFEPVAYWIPTSPAFPVFPPTHTTWKTTSKLPAFGLTQIFMPGQRVVATDSGRASFDTDGLWNAAPNESKPLCHTRFAEMKPLSNSSGFQSPAGRIHVISRPTPRFRTRRVSNQSLRRSADKETALHNFRLAHLDRTISEPYY